MRIMNADGSQIFECDYIQRYLISECTDAVLVKAGYADAAATLGRYGNMNEAKEALTGIFQALNDHKESFIMPDSPSRHEQQIIKDARTRRRGGS